MQKYTSKIKHRNKHAVLSMTHATAATCYNCTGCDQSIFAQLIT